MCIADAAIRPRCNRPGGRTETPGQTRRRADVDIAMICVAHDALLRSSELLALRWEDIDLPESGGCGTVRIRRSKTDQHGIGAVAPISEFTCQALARVRPVGYCPQDRVFDFSPNTVTRRFKAAAKAAGIDPTRVSSHSPRVGMAQDLAAQGVDMAGIMLAGRWTTATTVARYIKHLTAQHTPAAQFLNVRHHAPAPRSHSAPRITRRGPLHDPPPATPPAPPTCASTRNRGAHIPRQARIIGRYKRITGGRERIASMRLTVMQTASVAAKQVWPNFRDALTGLTQWERGSLTPRSTDRLSTSRSISNLATRRRSRARSARS